ncbi:alpha/beta fold hydrolase [Actinomadura macrotermitis]|uniref:AB hydrolase-1 domain-containing protein n=1 Tax=Actinomadura macrotermitis TaxID=2585200 RepID=A0A7K0C828_9ACTN|nr:alpha/beta fold hydrolase [Actinomadura macrotermitis]MQY08954.1 hypothetical protein [Actinomadura macrotermitis]
MTTFVLVHGAWHGPWAWDRVVPLLRAAGARTLTPDLGTPGDRGLHDDAATVAAALDGVPGGEEVVLVGHSYAGLAVREAADARPGAVGRIVLVDGWAGPDGAAMVTLAPASLITAVRAAAGDGTHVPAPPPAAFGIDDAGDAAWLAPRLVPQPLRTFTEPTRLSGAVDRIPGTAVHCEPATYPFERFGRSAGYRTLALDGPHDVMLARPEPLARILLDAASFKNRKREA